MSEQKPNQQGISQTPLIPLSITPSINENATITTQATPPTPPEVLPKQTPSRVPSISRKALSRNISMRNSRATSLIIPVMPEKDDNADNDITGNNFVDMQNSIITPDSPVLPMRPPHTPARPTHEEFQPQALESYGMDRIKGSEFSPVSNSKFSRRRSRSIDSGKSDLSFKEESYKTTKERYLIQSRKFQIENIINILSNAKLTVSNNTYFEKLHSSNDYIEVLSEIRASSFDTGNLPILYSLLLNSLKLKEDTFQIANSIQFDKETNSKFDSLINDLSPLIRSNEQQKQQFKNDLMKIYSVISITNEVSSKDHMESSTEKISIKPNAFVAAFVYRCASHNILPQAVIVAMMIDEFIIKSNEKSREFQFLLLRSIETIDPQMLLEESEKANPLSYVLNLINSNKFWCHFVLLLFKNDVTLNNHPLGLTNVLHRFVIYGVNSLIDVIIELRKELGIFNFGFKLNSQAPPLCDLVRFHREFLILNDSASAHQVSYSLEKLATKNQELEEILNEKKNAYNDLLHNYKQLNEEKISVAQQIQNLTNTNSTLAAEKRSLNAQVDQALGQFDVIKQTMEKNKRVQELNDSMSKEIGRLIKENQKLRT